MDVGLHEGGRLKCFLVSSWDRTLSFKFTYSLVIMWLQGMCCSTISLLWSLFKMDCMSLASFFFPFLLSSRAMLKRAFIDHKRPMVHVWQFPLVQEDLESLIKPPYSSSRSYALGNLISLWTLPSRRVACALARCPTMFEKKPFTFSVSLRELDMWARLGPLEVFLMVSSCESCCQCPDQGDRSNTSDPLHRSRRHGTPKQIFSQGWDDN